MNEPRYLVIHHTALDKAEQEATVDKSHAARGYNQSPTGSSIAYHYFIGKDGTLKNERMLTERTAHTRNDRINNSSISIAVAGDFTEEDPTPEQIRVLRSLISRLDSEFQFLEIAGHRDYSPTSCPGDRLLDQISDLTRIVWKEYGVSRYYTPVKGQDRYYRTVANKDFIHEMKAMEFIQARSDGVWYSYANDPVRIGANLHEADLWFSARPDTKEVLRKELEYIKDFRVNCHGDCLSTASSYKLKPEDAYRVAACPPDKDKNGNQIPGGMPFGTKLYIDTIGEVTCVDRGGAIKGDRIDVWAGIGMTGLNNLLTRTAGKLPVKRLN